MMVLMSVPGKLKKLLDRLTETRAGYLDLISTLNTRLSATWAGYLNTTKSNVDVLIARLTSARAAKLDGIANPLVQQGQVTIINGQSTAYATISEITLNKAELRFSWSCSNDSTENNQIRGKKNTTTQLRFDREGTSGNVTIEWEVTYW